MESFSLLRYWRASIFAFLLRPSPDSDEDDSGPFFDLDFAVPEMDDCTREPNNNEEDERGFKFAVSNTTLSFSPTDDTFFKGRIAAVDVAVACGDSRQPIFPVSLLKSATKLRVLMLRYRCPKPSAGDTEGVAVKPQMNFKVEEVPIVSLFTRGGRGRAAARETGFNKEYVQKYLSRIKPLYLRVSKRYGEKIRFSELVGRKEGETDGEAEVVGSGGVQVKRKSKSAPLAVTAEAVVPPKRRDDSLLQLQDGIQSAIAHCKRSFNAPKGKAVTSLRDSGDGRSDKPVIGP